MPNKFASAWIPPPMRAALNRAIGAHTRYRGPFASFDAARAATTGYDEDAILRRIVIATQQVLRGEARYEQDGVAFPHEPPASHALAGLLLAAARGQGRLSVLDFGGGLASHYLRWRSHLERLPEVRWAIVEQPAFVAEGRRLFAGDPVVSFHETVSDIRTAPNAVLASSVLQYLADPYARLQELADTGADIVALDRTPLADRDAIMAQHVPARTSKASYPLWVLAEDGIRGLLSRRYLQIDEFAAPDAPIRTQWIDADYRGSIWARRA